MRGSIVKRKLSAGEPVLCAKLNLLSPSSYKMTATMGFDCIWICNEHQYLSDESLEHLVLAAREGGADVMLRHNMSRHEELLQPLEMGVHGFMIPRVTEVGYLREVVAAVKFPPVGKRSNRETFIVAQIEEAVAVQRADELVAIDGVDVLLVGPGDLALQLGVPGQPRHEKVLAAMDTVAEACRRHGKAAGVTTATPEDASALMKRGYAFFGMGTDHFFVRRGLEELKRGFGSIGFTFRR